MDKDLEKFVRAVTSGESFECIVESFDLDTECHNVIVHGYRIEVDLLSDGYFCEETEDLNSSEYIEFCESLIGKKVLVGNSFPYILKANTVSIIE